MYADRDLGVGMPVVGRDHPNPNMEAGRPTVAPIARAPQPEQHFPVAPAVEERAP